MSNDVKEMLLLAAIILAFGFAGATCQIAESYGRNAQRECKLQCTKPVNECLEICK